MNLLINHGLPEETKYFNIHNFHVSDSGDNWFFSPRYTISFSIYEDEKDFTGRPNGRLAEKIYLIHCYNYFVAKYGVDIVVGGCMKIDPRYTEGQIKILKRAIERCKKSKDENGVKFYTELLEKGGVDIDLNEIIVSAPPPLNDK
jgi:hypothetical protein